MLIKVYYFLKGVIYHTLAQDQSMETEIENETDSKALFKAIIYCCNCCYLLNFFQISSL